MCERVIPRHLLAILFTVWFSLNFLLFSRPFRTAFSKNSFFVLRQAQLTRPGQQISHVGVPCLSFVNEGPRMSKLTSILKYNTYIRRIYKTALRCASSWVKVAWIMWLATCRLTNVFISEPSAGKYSGLSWEYICISKIASQINIGSPKQKLHSHHSHTLMDKYCLNRERLGTSVWKENRPNKVGTSFMRKTYGKVNEGRPVIAWCHGSAFFAYRPQSGNRRGRGHTHTVTHTTVHIPSPTQKRVKVKGFLDYAPFLHYVAFGDVLYFTTQFYNCTPIPSGSTKILFSPSVCAIFPLSFSCHASK